MVNENNLPGNAEKAAPYAWYALLVCPLACLASAICLQLGSRNLNKSEALDYDSYSFPVSSR